MSLPAADDLFRPTAVPEEAGSERSSGEDQQPDAPERQRAEPGSRRTGGAKERSSGRVRHDEKMTVYVTAEELLELEQTRLALRRHGVAVDRGRLVREAVAIALADFEEHGEDSLLVHRLTGP